MISYKIQSIIYIVLGAFILISFSGFLLQIIGIAIGLFLIYQGMRLRNPHNTTVVFTRMFRKFNDPFNHFRR
jgi:threonine/homoserine/homoserine lactone efflux protein